MASYLCSELPRAALVYGGCSSDGQVLCWMTSASLQPYLKSVPPGLSSDRLMAEQMILGVAAGDLQCRCLRMKVIACILYVDMLKYNSTRKCIVSQRNLKIQHHNATGYKWNITQSTGIYNV